MGENKNKEKNKAPAEDQAASGVPKEGWAVGDRFSWKEILLRIVASADEEISERPRGLFFSGLTAGFAIVLTLIGHATGRAQFHDNTFMAAILYPIGFIYIILGRYQLYTENTLPPVKLVLMRLASIPLLLRLWGIVLFANLLGTALGTFVMAHTHMLSQEVQNAAIEFVQHALTLSWWDIFFRALFAGWLVAGVVWINMAAKDTITRFALVYFVFFTIAACQLFHVITTAAEVLFVGFYDHSIFEIGKLFTQFWVPVFLGNTIGGVLVFTLVGYAQSERKYFPEVRVLNLREIVFSFKGGETLKKPPR